MNLRGVYRSFESSTRSRKALVVLGLVLIGGSFAACAAESEGDGAADGLSNGSGSQLPYKTNLELK